MKRLNMPISDEEIRELKIGDTVYLNGIMLTGRDDVHKWMIDTFIEKNREPSVDDREVYEKMLPILDGGVIYHCGPVVKKLEDGSYIFVAAGPTTSIREEPYQSRIMAHFNAKGVIGKGGMGAQTLKGCQEIPAVYLHAIGGAATLIAESVEEVLDVYKLDFGVPEAIWVLKVKDFPVVVTMDSHGESIHNEIQSRSKIVLDSLI